MPGFWNCGSCYGTGRIYLGDDEYMSCPRCDGRGRSTWGLATALVGVVAVAGLAYIAYAALRPAELQADVTPTREEKTILPTATPAQPIGSSVSAPGAVVN